MDKLFFLVKQRLLVFNVVTLLLLSFFLFACAESVSGKSEKSVTSITFDKTMQNQLLASAVWNAEAANIRIEGVSFPGGGQINVYDGQDSGTFLGVADVNADGSWMLELLPSELGVVPCNVYVISENTDQKIEISDVPNVCGAYSKSIQSREVIAASGPPDGVIESPPGNTIEVVKGSSLTFDASASDPDGDTNFTFMWDFGSYALRKVGQRVTLNFDTIATVNAYLFVRDSTGLWDPTKDMITINVVNASGGGANPPQNPTPDVSPNGIIIRPRSDQNISVGDSVRFEANGSDPQGRQLDYSWDFGVSGVPSSNKKEPGRLKFNNPGTFDVRMTVTNDLGLADSTPDKVKITVAPGNSIASAPEGIIVSPSKSGFFIAVGDSLTLMGSASGSDDEDITYTWDVGAYGPPKTGQNVDMVFNNLGPVTLSLLVANKNGQTDPTPAQLTFNVVQIVADANSAPFSEIVAPMLNKTINAGEAVFFSGNALDPDGDMPLHFLWDFDGALPFSTAQTPGAVIFTTPGVYRVTMRAIDSLGQADQTADSRVITVNGTNASPPNSFINSPAGNVTINVGSSIDFSGSATDPDNNAPYNYLWDFAGVAPSSTQANPGSITFDTAGIYTISLRAGDASGAKDPTPATVTVSVTSIVLFNEPPDSTIITPSMDMIVYEGDSLEFLGTAVDPNDDFLSYFWNFDGAARDQQQINPGFVRFNREGVYNVTLTSVDPLGLADPTPASVQITVKSPPSSVAPNGIITSPGVNMNINAGDSLTFNGFGTDADGNMPLNYLWNFDGAVPNLRVNSPGLVTFATPGLYRVRLSVTDASGLTDPTPAERIVVVAAVNQPNGNIAPNGVIMTPAENVKVIIGESLAFAGAGIDPDGNLPLTYRWNFDGVIPNSIAQNPGLVTFTRVGTYRIVLSTTDEKGSADPTPAERLITVVGNATTNRSPSATITFPRGNQNIPVNGVVNFMGTGSDPDNNTPLSFMWDFDGAVPNVVGQNPKNVTFKKAGVFNVTLNVVDSQGAVSSNSPSVLITVGGTSGGGTDGGTGGTTGGGSGGSTANWEIISPNTNVLNLSLGSTYTFEGSKMGADGRLSSFSFWNFGGYFPLNSIGSSVTKTFSRPGSISVKYYSKAATGTFSTPDVITINVQ